MDLSSLNRLVFGHHITVEMLMKQFPLSSPQDVVPLEADGETPVHSVTQSFLNKLEIKVNLIHTVQPP
jgi:hypothetical protein